MALIEGFRVRDYRALHDITLGKLSTQQQGEPLTPFTVVIGKNGVGKSTLFDAFGFVSDCLSNLDANASPSFCKFRDGLRRLVA
jgi:AAA15 family ATPase/GTPase